MSTTINGTSVAKVEMEKSFKYEATLERWGKSAIEDTFRMEKVGRDLTVDVQTAMGCSTGKEGQALREGFYAKVRKDIKRAVGRDIDPENLCKLAWLVETLGGADAKKTLKLPADDALSLASIVAKRRKGCQEYKFPQLEVGGQTCDGDDVAMRMCQAVVFRQVCGLKDMQAHWKNLCENFAEAKCADDPELAKKAELLAEVAEEKKAAKAAERLKEQAAELGLHVSETKPIVLDHNAVLGWLASHPDEAMGVLKKFAGTLGKEKSEVYFGSVLDAAFPEPEFKGTTIEVTSLQKVPA